MTKIALCNIAIRPKPDSFPPAACTTLFNALTRAGYDPVFYDIDAERPSPEKLFEFFKRGQFYIVGISAVVSTGYRYVKDLSAIIKEASPKTCVILGGNLAAAYEVVLRKCRVDLCVIGEGDKVLVNIVRHLERCGRLDPDDRDLYKIKGVAFLSAAGETAFTGQGELVSSDEIEQPDYDLLKKFSRIDQYILDPVTRHDFAYDNRTYEPARKGKKMATIFTSKGCINKCTFCHRWIKGYRVMPVEKVIAAIKHLMEAYNVGFFCISDECFGESGQWLEEFIRSIKPLNVLFQIGGMRVSVVKKDPTVIRRLKEAGLTAAYFGMESGSDKILKVMEKNATRDENLFAARICAEAGIYTIIQLVIGMPGENDRTIDETIEFARKATEGSVTSMLSINYLQALPGTPSYDLLRHRGMLGASIDDEERYLLKVSDVNASDFSQYTNVSEEDLARVRLWKTKIFLSTEINRLKHQDWKFSQQRYTELRADGNERSSLGAYVKGALKRSALTYRIIDMIGGLFWAGMLSCYRFQIYGMKKGLLTSLGIINEEKIHV